MASLTDLGAYRALYTAPVDAGEPSIDACSCFVAGWGDHTDDSRELPETISAPCGWCGTFTPPAIRLPTHRLVVMLRQATPSNHTPTIRSN